MHVEPITCYRPRPERAAEFAAPPYDTFDRDGARAYVAEHPTSFLAVDRPETAFPPDHDMYADDVYARAHDLLVERAGDGTLLRDGTPCFYLWRLRADGHEQTGIVAAFSIDDYTNGVIRRHELTRPAKVEDRARHIMATCCQTGPALLAYRDNPVLEALVEAAKAADALYELTDASGVEHTIWRVARPAAVESLRLMLEYVDRAYIADGHHRIAAAERVCHEMRTAEGGALQRRRGVQLLPWASSSPRASSPCARTTASSRTRTASPRTSSCARSRPAASPSGPAPSPPSCRRRPVGPACAPSAHGASSRSQVRCRPTPLPRSTPRSFRSACSAPCSAWRTPRATRASRSWATSTRASSSGGRARGGVAFALYPTSVEQVMSVADAGLTMPPKSTWFAPKLLSGLFIRRVNHREVIIDGTRQSSAA